MKYCIGIFLLVGHLLFIVTNSASHTIKSYFEFYGVKDAENVITKGLNTYTTGFKNFVIQIPVQVYAKYTGAETGYGFFAPNVLSSGVITFQYRGKTLIPKFKYAEGGLRYTAMISRFIGYYVSPQNDTTAMIIKGKKQTYKNFEELESKYYALALKNVASKIYCDFGCADTLNTNVYLYDFPSLDVFDNIKSNQGSFIPIKQNKIFLPKNISHEKYSFQSVHN